MRLLFLLSLAFFSTATIVQADSQDSSPQPDPAGDSAATEEPHREVIEYRAKWTKFNVGSGRVVVVKGANLTTVEYRMNFEVKVLGARAYYLDSHQQVVFDSGGKLLQSRTAADINGERSKGSIELQRNNTYAISFDDNQQVLPAESFVFTTMSSLYRRPIDGQWLDLTDGSVVAYKAVETDKGYQLTRPDGSDELEYNDDDYMVKITSAIKVGSVVLKRKSEAVRELEDLIAEEDQILDDLGRLRKAASPAENSDAVSKSTETQDDNLQGQEVGGGLTK